MFVGLTVFCVVLGLVVVPAEQQKREVESLREIEGALVIYDFENPYVYAPIGRGTPDVRHGLRYVPRPIGA